MILREVHERIKVAKPNGTFQDKTLKIQRFSLQCKLEDFFQTFCIFPTVCKVQLKQIQKREEKIKKIIQKQYFIIQILWQELGMKHKNQHESIVVEIW